MERSSKPPVSAAANDRSTPPVATMHLRSPPGMTEQQQYQETLQLTRCGCVPQMSLVYEDIDPRSGSRWFPGSTSSSSSWWARRIPLLGPLWCVAGAGPNGTTTRTRRRDNAVYRSNSFKFERRKDESLASREEPVMAHPVLHAPVSTQQIPPQDLRINLNYSDPQDAASDYLGTVNKAFIQEDDLPLTKVRLGGDIYYCRPYQPFHTQLRYNFSDLTESGVDNDEEYEEMVNNNNPHHRHNVNNNAINSVSTGPTAAPVSNNKHQHNNINNNNNNNSGEGRRDENCSTCVTVISVCPSPARPGLCHAVGTPGGQPAFPPGAAVGHLYQQVRKCQNQAKPNRQSRPDRSSSRPISQPPASQPEASSVLSTTPPYENLSFHKVTISVPDRVAAAGMTGVTSSSTSNGCDSNNLLLQQQQKNNLQRNPPIKKSKVPLKYQGIKRAKAKSRTVSSGARSASTSNIDSSGAMGGNPAIINGHHLYKHDGSGQAFVNGGMLPRPPHMAAGPGGMGRTGSQAVGQEKSGYSQKEVWNWLYLEEAAAAISGTGSDGMIAANGAVFGGQPHHPHQTGGGPGGPQHPARLLLDRYDGGRPGAVRRSSPSSASLSSSYRSSCSRTVSAQLNGQSVLRHRASMSSSTSSRIANHHGQADGGKRDHRSVSVQFSPVEFLSATSRLAHLNLEGFERFVGNTFDRALAASAQADHVRNHHDGHLDEFGNFLHDDEDDLGDASHEQHDESGELEDGEEDVEDLEDEDLSSEGVVVDLHHGDGLMMDSQDTGTYVWRENCRVRPVCDSCIRSGVSSCSSALSSLESGGSRDSAGDHQRSANHNKNVANGGPTTGGTTTTNGHHINGNASDYYATPRQMDAAQQQAVSNSLQQHYVRMSGAGRPKLLSNNNQDGSGMMSTGATKLSLMSNKLSSAAAIGKRSTAGGKVLYSKPYQTLEMGGLSEAGMTGLGPDGLTGLDSWNRNTDIQLVDTSIQLHQQEWYHGNVSRTEAEAALRLQSPGSYLVRNCESANKDYSLSLKSNNGFMHMRIQVTPQGQFILGQFSRPFPSIPHMINYYTVNRLPIKGAEHISLKAPVCEQLL